MKKLHTHAIFALAFMLGLAMPIATIIMARPASAIEQADGTSTTAADASSLVAALQNNAISTITLSGNITLDPSSDIVISRTTPLTVDLNGFNLTTTGKTAITIAQGSVTFTGSGVISAARSVIKAKGSTDSAATNYTVITIDQNVTLRSASEYGLAVVPMSTDPAAKDSRCYGVVVSYNGKADGAYGLSIHGNIQDTTNAPRINIGNTAQLTANGSDADNAPIYAAGYGNWTIGAATLTGKMGIGLKAGAFTLNGTKLTANGDFNSPSTGPDGIDGTGVAFQIEHQRAYANEDIVININGGTYTSAHDVFYEYGDNAARSITAPADINITSGTFTAGAGYAIFGGDYTQDDISISGGTFKGADVSSFQTRGYLASNLTINDDGTVVVSTSGGGSSRPSNPDTDTIQPIEPSAPDSNNDPSAPVPDTGLNQGVGAISAVATIVPLMIGAVLLFSLYGKRLHKHRQTEIVDDLVAAIDAQPVTVEAASEPIVERFEAVAIDRPTAPVTTPVDSFIKK